MGNKLPLIKLPKSSHSHLISEVMDLINLQLLCELDRQITGVE